MICPDGCGLDKPELSGYEPEENMRQHTPTPWKFLGGDLQLGPKGRNSTLEARVSDAIARAEKP